ncbi:peroxiredoxin family protein [Winogradskyella immobilis]|uniref:thioredoxin-dependent peroxiredoxin n=1 Tax=Winogradskyella immobilis TaxID=2816852 RepID=A0ABS8ELM6_9FLAO|nr:peroxiredoxin family protein [Winogradskyella immobilis]MCC1484113.1 redoxin domain-containing protein [Winogradskyella immobilis]MCG0016205.1 peroxiredoxin family protein [Winogradskyella immobilis]
MKGLLKSLFISIFPAFGLYVLILSAWQLTQQNNAWIQNIGTLVMALMVFSFFGGLFLKSQARTSRNLNTHTLVILIAYIVILIGRFIEPKSNLVYYSSTFLVFGWITYLTWFSTFKKRDTSVLNIGNKLPEFQLENSKKEIINASSFIGQPSIWLFYRGNWCPLCMAQIKEVASQYQELEKRGVSMILVSPQPHKNSEDLAKKFNVGFHFLTDYKNKAAKQLGILHANGIPAGFQVMGYDSDTVLPTVVITDASGKIIFADLTDNYRIRPEPETFLSVLAKI